MSHIYPTSECLSSLSKFNRRIIERADCPDWKGCYERQKERWQARLSKINPAEMTDEQLFKSYVLSNDLQLKNAIRVEINKRALLKTGADDSDDDLCPECGLLWEDHRTYPATNTPWGLQPEEPVCPRMDMNKLIDY